MLEDKTLKCKECGQDFVFSVGEQEFYSQKGFQNEPVRCAACRQARKRERAASGGNQFRDYGAPGGIPARSGFDRRY